MGNIEFENRCIELVHDYIRECGDIVYFDEIFIVWMSKVLQNNKALVSTTLDNDTRYYEITYNGDKDEIYFDCYSKDVNRTYVKDKHNLCFELKSENYKR